MFPQLKYYRCDSLPAELRSFLREIEGATPRRDQRVFEIGRCIPGRGLGCQRCSKRIALLLDGHLHFGL